MRRCASAASVSGRTSETSTRTRAVGRELGLAVELVAHHHGVVPEPPCGVDLAGATDRADHGLCAEQPGHLAQLAPTGDAYLALVADSYGDSLLAENLRDRYIVPRRARATEVLERGVARGELPSDLDFDVTIDAMYGALYYRLLVAHTELDAGYVDQLLDQFYRALT